MPSGGQQAPWKTSGMMSLTAVVTWSCRRQSGAKRHSCALMEPVQRDRLTASFDCISQQQSQPSPAQKSPDPFISECYSSLCRPAVDSSVCTFQCSSKIWAFISASASHAKHLAHTPRPATCAAFRSVVTRGWEPKPSQDELQKPGILQREVPKVSHHAAGPL